MTSMVEFNNVCKTFGSGPSSVAAVRNVSLSVQSGSVVGLVGESGSGKSTLANLLLGIEELDSGRIVVDEKPVEEWLRTDPRGYRELVQAVFQYPIQALDSRKRVGWLIEEPLIIHDRGSRQWREDKVRALMADVHLDEELMQRYPSELSGGQAQRVNIARALSLEPRVLVCDEPVSALDVSVQAQILNLLLELQASHQMSMLFISHSLAVVRHLSNRIVVMYAGTVVEEGLGQELVGGPAHPYTDLLVGAAIGRSLPNQDRRPMASVDGLPNQGCRFEPRCSLATEECRTSEPNLEVAGIDRYVRCWNSQLGIAD